MTKFDIDFMEQTYAIVSEIPKGSVATYGQIAKLSGHPKNSRMVGRALKHSKIYGKYPCHRVVNHEGRTVLNWPEQIELLKAEGITFKNNKVDLDKHKWKVNI